MTQTREEKAAVLIAWAQDENATAQYFHAGAWCDYHDYGRQEPPTVFNRDNWRIKPHHELFSVERDISEKRDVYSEFATEVYGRKITKADTVERFVGKVAVISLGYGAGAAKFRDMLRVQGQVEIDQNEAPGLDEQIEWLKSDVKAHPNYGHILASLERLRAATGKESEHDKR